MPGANVLAGYGTSYRLEDPPEGGRGGPVQLSAADPTDLSWGFIAR